MTKQQREYAARRVNDILEEKVNKLKERYTTPATEYTHQQRKRFVEDGEYEVDRLDTYGRAGGSWVLYIRFPQEQRAVLNEEEFEKEVTPLRKRATEIKDELYLGDAEEALQLIQEFANA